jgi:hypothetical protein
MATGRVLRASRTTIVAKPVESTARYNPSTHNFDDTGIGDLVGG